MLAITAVVGGGAQAGAGVVVVPPRLHVLGWEGELEVGEGVHGEEGWDSVLLHDVAAGRWVNVLCYCGDLIFNGLNLHFDFPDSSV